MTLISVCKAQIYKKENFKTCAEKTRLRGEQSVYYSVKFIKIRRWYFLPVSHSWGGGQPFPFPPSPNGMSASPRNDHLWPVREEQSWILWLRPAGNSARALLWGGKWVGAVQFLVPNWKFQMFIMPAAPNQLSDPTCLIVVEWWHDIFRCCVHVNT